jgi:hypothetical protein
VFSHTRHAQTLHICVLHWEAMLCWWLQSLLPLGVRLGSVPPSRVCSVVIVKLGIPNVQVKKQTKQPYIPQIQPASVNIRNRVGPPRRRSARQGVDRTAAGPTCPRPALELFATVFHTAKASLIVNASSCRVCALRARHDLEVAVTIGGSRAPRACRIMLQCR